MTGLPPSHHYCIETVEPSGDNYCIDMVVLSLLLPHFFPLLCGVDVSYETPPFSPVLRVLPLQFSLRQIVPDAIHPPPLWTSSPSFSRHLNRHHSLAYVFVFSSQYMPIPLQPIFLHFRGYFSHLRCPSNSFIPNSVQLGDSILTSSFPPHPTSFIVLSSLPKSRHRTSLLVFPLDSQTYSSVAQNPRYPLPVFPQ